MNPADYDDMQLYKECRMVWESVPWLGPVVSDTPLTVVIMRGDQTIVKIPIDLNEFGGKLYGIGIR